MGMNRRSFTLIEIIVVVGVIALVLPVLFSIVFSIFNVQIKVLRLSQVKREGDFTLSTIENVIRNNGQKIYSDSCSGPVSTEVCNQGAASFPASYSSATGSNFCFTDDADKVFYFYLNGTTISSASANLTSPDDLTTSNVTISNFAISCKRGAKYSPPFVTVSFTACYGTCSSTRAEEQASIDYQTTIKLHGL